MELLDILPDTFTAPRGNEIISNADIASMNDSVKLLERNS